MPNVLFYLQHNGEEYVTPSYDGKTIRQLFQAGFDRGALDQFNLDSVQLTVNTKADLFNMNSRASDVIAQFVNAPGVGADLDIYVVAQEPTGTKAATSFSEAEAAMERLEEKDWSLDDEDTHSHTYCFRQGSTVREIIVTREDFSAYADVGVGRLIAAVKLEQQLNRGSEAPATPAATSASATSLIQQIADQFGVTAEQVSISIRG